MTQVEKAIGVNDICEMLDWCESTFYRRRAEMERLGVIFYIRKGRPPRPQIKAFPSRIIKYAGLCCKKRRPPDGYGVEGIEC